MTFHPSPSRPHRRPAAAALALALTAACAAPATAQDDPKLAEPLRVLVQRLQQLEQRNAELERRVQQLAAKPAVESAAAGEPEAADGADEGGPEIGASVVAVGQRVNAGGAAAGRASTRLAYRGDLTIATGLGALAGAQASAFGHLRFGQGSGVALRPTHTGAVNSAAFETGAGPDDSFAILAQGWLQLEWALGGDGFNDRKGSSLALTAGKLDFFGFFDQNAVAADEAGQFLNNVFVHNPLLDSGGDIAADAYGFAPGLRVAWQHVGERWNGGVSAGVFGAGAGASFGGGLGRPLAVVQAELSPMQINGEPRGTWRAYAWTNGRTTGLAGAEQRHSGWGLSVDQRIGAGWNLFGRIGRRTAGEGAFDRAVTLGFEHGGRAWGRGSDAVGLAWGRLSTDRSWRAATQADPSFGYAATTAEQVWELYYRMKLNDRLTLSPDLQLIRRPGGDAAAPTVRVLGLRATLGF